MRFPARLLCRDASTLCRQSQLFLGVSVVHPFAETDAIFDLIAELAVELDDAFVRGPDLQIDFQAAAGDEGVLEVSDERRSDSLTLMFGRDCQRVDPAAMAVVASHHGADNVGLEDRHVEQIPVGDEFLPDDPLGIVVRGAVGKDFIPEADDGRSIFDPKSTDERFNRLGHQ